MTFVLDLGVMLPIICFISEILRCSVVRDEDFIASAGGELGEGLLVAVDGDIDDEFSGETNSDSGREF
jgi:hypothetical protein